ncbi:MAG: hypothetical protein AMS27_03955 [Bacteroides sp. SM23_62_1]|nr:MAG: hypothetical protein AMS27_03955 [Bacteroides sp. SM23_62_1]
MHDIRFLDETLDIHKINSYHLSIQAGLDGFSFAILDPGRFKYIALKHFSYPEKIPEDKYPDHLRELIMKDDFLPGEYDSIYCIWLNARSTLLPSALFDKNNLKKYFEFNHILHDLDELHANHLKSPDAYLIFPVHHEIANIFIRHYPRLKFFNQATPFIEYALHNVGDGTEATYLNIYKDFFDIVVIRNHSLILHNTFQYRNEQDFIYFIMNVFDKIQLNPGTCPVYLSGMIEKKSAMSGIVKKFIKTVHFAKPDKRFQYSHAFDRIPEHFFIHLYNLYNCG